MMHLLKSDESHAMANDASILEHFQQVHPWGISTAIDLKQCDPSLIRREEKIRQFADELCAFINMKKFGDCVVVHFGQDPRVAGFSMTQLIETSLVSGHFANEANAVYIDIFSCIYYPPYATARFVQTFFGAEDMRLSVTFRI